jgi:hypothetical protein
MSLNLLAHATTQGTVFFLDDQPATLGMEREVVRSMGLKEKTLRRPRPFLDSVFEWSKKRQELPAEEQAECRAVLVVDNNLKPAIDIRRLTEEKDILLEAKEKLPRDDFLDPWDGARSGLLLIQHVLRAVKQLRELPVVLLSAYSMKQHEDTVRRINEKYISAPTVCVPKAVAEVKAEVQEKFAKETSKLIFDPGLCFLQKLTELWDLDEGELRGTLALRKGGLGHIAQLFNRAKPPLTDDTEQRVNGLKVIHRNLAGLFGFEKDSEIEWLRKPNPDLGNVEPITLITSGEFTKLALVRAYLDALAQGNLD